MNDLINRQEAIDALDRAAECWNIAEPFNDGMKAGYKAAVTIVLSLPSAQLEPRRGKWYDWDGNLRTSGYCGVCSACGDDSEYLTDYCPNCGADMRETWEDKK